MTARTSAGAAQLGRRNSSSAIRARRGTVALERGNERLEVRRQCGLDFDLAPVARVRKHELRRVQRLAPESAQGPGERGGRAARNREALPVYRIADQRI